jgi:hypothetical protein
MLDEPLPEEPMTDRDRRDALLTWGILNPFGPTRVQICRVPVDDKTDALVYTLHNRVGPVCLLLGTARSDHSGTVPGLLLELAQRFELGEEALLKGLPHWVVASTEAEPAAAAFFHTAHATALQKDLAIDNDIEDLIESLHRLRLDAQQ